jgi:hypothetical protein
MYLKGKKYYLIPLVSKAWNSVKLSMSIDTFAADFCVTVIYLSALVTVV